MRSAMRSANRSELRLLLDTNIVVDFAIGASGTLLREEERAAANFALKLIMLSGYKLLIPEIAVKVEFPRAFLRIILERHITNEEKLQACVRTLKYIENVLAEAGHEIVECWNVDVVKTAAGWFHRIASSKSADWIRHRHQDLIVLATAKVNDAVLVTRNPRDFEKILEAIAGKNPICAVEVTGSRVRLRWINTEPIESMEELASG